MVIGCKFKKNLFNLTVHTSFHDFINVYSRRQGQTIHLGQKFDVNRNILSLRSFATSFKKLSLKSDFIHFFHDFIHVQISQRKKLFRVHPANKISQTQTFAEKTPKNLA